MLVLSASLNAQLTAAARAAFPDEVCGLLEGVRDGGNITVTALHPSANLSPAPRDSFVLDLALQFALQRSLRGTGREIVGCYHSHPNGRALPSPRDLENGCPAGFAWIIIATGVNAGANDALAAFEGPSFQSLTIRV